MTSLIIIGCGPAGLTASIYASRYQVDHLVIGKSLGGEMALSSKIENYPGFKEISGADLTQRMAEQVKGLGGKILDEGVVRIDPPSSVSWRTTEGRGSSFQLTTESGETYQAKAVILATGTERRKLGIPGEREYTGKGLSFCATCDAPLFRNKTVAVIGGANAAAQGALLLSDFAKKVYIIYRRKPLRADPVLVERIQKQMEKGKIELIYETNITEICGDGSKVTGVVLDPPKADGEDVASLRSLLSPSANVLPVDGVFIEIGGVPGTALVKPLGVELDRKGFIKVDLGMKTSIPGLFAVGDITSSGALLQQITTACAQGAMAASSVYEYLKQKSAPPLRG